MQIKHKYKHVNNRLLTVSKQKLANGAKLNYYVMRLYSFTHRLSRHGRIQMKWQQVRRWRSAGQSLVLSVALETNKRRIYNQLSQIVIYLWLLNNEFASLGFQYRSRINRDLFVTVTNIWRLKLYIIICHLGLISQIVTSMQNSLANG
jgi:hypothetical protein